MADAQEANTAPRAVQVARVSSTLPVPDFRSTRRAKPQPCSIAESARFRKYARKFPSSAKCHESTACFPQPSLHPPHRARLFVRPDRPPSRPASPSPPSPRPPRASTRYRRTLPRSSTTSSSRPPSFRRPRRVDAARRSRPRHPVRPRSRRCVSRRRVSGHVQSMIVAGGIGSWSSSSLSAPPLSSSTA